MVNFIYTILIFFCLILYGCVNIDSKDTIILESKIDSIIYANVKDYCYYLDTTISKYGGDKSYSILIEFHKSFDTLSYLITCNKSNDISRIISNSLIEVYKIDNHFVFSKTKLFSDYWKLDIDKVLKRMDNDAYTSYIKKGIKPVMRWIWDCESLYLVIKKDSILSNEIKY
jgi:hypothetical protein